VLGHRVLDTIVGVFVLSADWPLARKAEAHLQNTGLADTCFFGAEAEFFIFDNVSFDSTPNAAFYEIDAEEGRWNAGRKENNHGYRPRYKEGYFPVAPTDTQQDIRTEMVLEMEKAGIAIAGIDVGESFGSPDGRKLFSAFHRELTEKRGFSPKPVLLGRSRGGLMTLGWAVENADKVGGFAGVYPVCNIASYPGVPRASGAFRLKPEELEAQLARHNPIDRLEALAKAKVPLFAIHGDIDKVVPLEANSGEVRKRYESLGGEMQLIVPAGQGHNMWSGFFQCQELVDFVIANAKSK